jgi:predicted metal-dependent HD superfamily phosphohydrolase
MIPKLQLRTYFDVALEGCDQMIRNTCWHLIVQAYSEPHRAYHTLDHLELLINDHQALGVELDQARLLTIFYHDVFYSVHSNSKTNEIHSAEIFEQTARHTLNLSEDLTDTVKEEILKTDYSQHLSISEFGDFDFCNFAYYNRMCWASANIRFEHRLTSDSKFVEGRLRFLQSLLHERIYFTDHMHLALEEVSKQNIQRELDELKKGYNSWAEWCSLGKSGNPS